MTIKLSIPTNCAAYLGETEGMDFGELYRSNKF